MGLHYNAFISYKHAELDNKVAAEIEKQLERYHIPKKIQKKTGVKKIERIFRDKDELPITSDLTDTINEALLNSDYLIVLCSKSTHLSTWVEREINLFLQTHPLDHVLTVLAEGEPYEVIPPILLSRQVQRYNSLGQIETVIEPVEPLSCDWRLPKKEAINTELPRLAAALIGCSYNELMNRQRQYKMRRLSAIAAGVAGLSIGFGAYMLYSNQKINENYKQSLINQSRYLSNASEQLLEQEHRTDALHLALEALPNESNPDRPVIPEAIRALNKASLAYVPESGSNITAVWNYTMPASVDKYEFATDGSSFAAIDTLHNVKVWNCETRQELYCYDSAQEVASNIIYLNENILLITGSHFLKAIDVNSGNIVWEKDALKEKQTDSLFEFTPTINGDPVILKDGTILIGTYNDGVYRLSPFNGEEIGHYVILPEQEEWYSSAEIYDFDVSPDQTKLVLLVESGDEEYGIATLDMANGDYYMTSVDPSWFFDGSAENISKLVWIDDGIYISVSEGNLGSSSYSFGGMEVINNSVKYLYCLNDSDLNLRWEKVFTYDAISYKNNFVELPWENAVMFYGGNIAEVYDKQTGESLNRYNVNASIIGVSSSSDRESVTLYTNTGKMVNPDENGGLTAMKYFSGDVRKLVINKGVYTYTGGNEIIYYGVGVYDENYQDFKDNPEIENCVYYYLDDDILVIKNGDDSQSYVDFFDVSTKEYVGRVKIGDMSEYSCELLGLENKKAYAVDKYGDNFSLIELDADTLSSREIKVSESSNFDTYGDPIIKDGKLIYFDSSYGDNGIVCFDINSGEQTKYPVEDGIGSYKGGFEYSSESSLIYYYGENDCIVNTETGEVSEAVHSNDWNGTKKAYIDDTNKMIMTSDNAKIHVRTFGGEEVCTITCPDLKLFGFTIYTPLEKDSKAQILVIYSDGFLYRYDLESGEYIAQSELTYSGTTDDMDISFDYERKVMYVKGEYILDIVDIDSWIELTYIYDALGYHEATDSFIVTAYDTSYDHRIGYYKQYTLEELIQRANEMLTGSQMSEDFKKLYGIG